MKILLIDNETTLLKKLQDLIPGAEITKKYQDVQPDDAYNFDMIILSGSSRSSVVSNHADFGDEINLIRHTQKPLIGICFGCELITYAFGGTLKEFNPEHKGIRDIQILDTKLSPKILIHVYEHHHWLIDKLPKDFEILATSSEEPALIKHSTLPIYGLQFHPENLVDENEGHKIFEKILRDLTPRSASS